MLLYKFWREWRGSAFAFCSLTLTLFLCIDLFFVEALHILVVDLFNYKPAESCFRRTVGDWLDLVTSRILQPRIMIVPTHLDKFDPSDGDSVVNRCKDILERVQQYCESQKAQIELEITEKKKKGLKNPVQGGTDPEWKKKNPPVISSSLHSSVVPVSYCELCCQSPSG